MGVVKLTGKRRFRLLRTWSGEKLILQVQVEGLVSEYNCGRVTTEHRQWWIDAQIEHLTIHERHTKESDHG